MTRPCRLLLASLALLVATGTGCTAVPDSSAPQVVEPVRLDQDNSSAQVGPQPGAAPRVIVQDFLNANALDPADRAVARSYLTPSARNQWSDQRVTIITDPQVKTGDPRTGVLQVYGRVLGSINADGVYTPSLQGIGGGGDPTVFPFTLKKVNGQYRIDELRSGLLITDDQFRLNYQQHVLYFFDLADRLLVPDVRWTAVPSTSPTLLARWLVDQLLGGPRPDLADSVSTDTFPAQLDPSRVAVQGDSASLTVDLGGSSQLDAAVRNRLAEQLAATLVDTVPGGTVTITDGGRPVTIPAVGGSTFQRSDFQSTAPAVTSADLYLVDGGRIADEDGKPLTGALAREDYYLFSAAVCGARAGASAAVAAVSGTGPHARLLVGTMADGLRATSVQGQLSRPAWLPGCQELWVGVGSTLHHLTVHGTSATDAVVQLPTAADGGRITAVRVSPDGSSVAVVVAGAGGGQLYVGAVVRDTDAVRLPALEPVSPAGISVADVGWSAPLKVVVVGTVTGTSSSVVAEVGVDGSFWTSRGTVGLPGAAETVTASEYGPLVVEADQQVWKLDGASWVSLSPLGQVDGTAPIYSVGVASPTVGCPQSPVRTPCRSTDPGPPWPAGAVPGDGGPVLPAVLHDALDLVLPARCVGCGRGGGVWCRACRPGPEALRVSEVAGLLVTAGGAYDGALRSAILSWKERGRGGLRGPLAGVLARAVAHALDGLPAGGPVVLVPVPTSAAASRARGGDLLARLTRSAGAGCGVRSCRGALALERQVRDSVGLGRRARQANLRGAFAATAGPPGWRALVVDDVVTSGATIAEAVRALRAAGWVVGGAAVLADTPPPARSPPGARSVPGRWQVGECTVDTH